MALTTQGDYSFGRTPRDVWTYCVVRNRKQGMIAPTHRKQAVCKARRKRSNQRCGHKIFRVLLSEEDGAFAERTCAKCGDAHEMLKDDEPLPEGYDDDFETSKASVFAMARSLKSSASRHPATGDTPILRTGSTWACDASNAVASASMPIGRSVTTTTRHCWPSCRAKRGGLR